MNAVEAKGVRVCLYEVNGYRASEELIRAADEFVDVVDIKDEIRFENGTQRG